MCRGEGDDRRHAVGVLGHGERRHGRQVRSRGPPDSVGLRFRWYMVARDFYAREKSTTISRGITVQKWREYNTY